MELVACWMILLVFFQFSFWIGNIKGTKDSMHEIVGGMACKRLHIAPSMFSCDKEYIFRYSCPLFFHSIPAQLQNCPL